MHAERVLRTFHWAFRRYFGFACTRRAFANKWWSTKCGASIQSNMAEMDVIVLLSHRSAFCGNERQKTIVSTKAFCYHPRVKYMP